MAIFGNFWQSLAIFGDLWQYLAILGDLRQASIIEITGNLLKLEMDEKFWKFIWGLEFGSCVTRFAGLVSEVKVIWLVGTWWILPCGTLSTGATPSS